MHQLLNMVESIDWSIFISLFCSDMLSWLLKPTYFCFKVQGEISAQEKNIIEIKRAIEDKNGPMMVSQSRLGERTERPNVELCRDPVQYRLINEVSEQITLKVKKIVYVLW